MKIGIHALLHILTPTIHAHISHMWKQTEIPTSLYLSIQQFNKGNAKCGVSPRLKIRPCDLNLWPCKSIGFQILLCTKCVPSLVKIHWRLLILECSQGCYVKQIDPLTLTFDLWPWKSIGFHILLTTKYVPSLVKIHWRMLILECSQGCYGRTEWRTDDSVTISLCNFIGKGITMILQSNLSMWSPLLSRHLYLKVIYLSCHRKFKMCLHTTAG